MITNKNYSSGIENLKVLANKKINDIERMAFGGRIDIKNKTDLAKIIEEPCLAACEDLYDKNILTYFSSSNRHAPNEAYICIVYSSLDLVNKAFADKLLADGKAEEFEYYDIYGIKIGIKTNSELLVSDVSKQLKQAVAQFGYQDILYNMYTPKDLDDAFNYRLGRGGDKKLRRFPLLDDVGISSLRSSQDTVNALRRIDFEVLKTNTVPPPPLGSIEAKSEWFYDETSGNIYKNIETLDKHKDYMQYKQNQKKQPIIMPQKSMV